MTLGFSQSRFPAPGTELCYLLFGQGKPSIFVGLTGRIARALWGTWSEEVRTKEWWWEGRGSGGHQKQCVKKIIDVLNCAFKRCVDVILGDMVLRWTWQC